MRPRKSLRSRPQTSLARSEPLFLSAEASTSLHVDGFMFFMDGKSGGCIALLVLFFWFNDMLPIHPSELCIICLLSQRPLLPTKPRRASSVFSTAERGQQPLLPGV
jgi:hypothetical protein